MLNSEVYQKSFLYTTAPAQSAGQDGAIGYLCQVGSTVAGYGVPIRFPVVMRAAPTMTYYSPSAASAKWYNLSGATESGTASFGAATDTELDNRTRGIFPVVRPEGDGMVYLRGRDGSNVQAQ